MRRTLRRLAPGLLPVLLVGAIAVGTAPAGAAGLDAVSVTGASGTEPTVTIAAPFSVDATTSKVVANGPASGKKTRTGETVKVAYVIYDGRTGQLVESSYGQGDLALPLNAKKALPSLVKAMTGRRPGDRVVLAVAPSEGLTQNAPASSGVEAGDTLVFVVDVVKDTPALKRATGRKVAPVDGLPKVTLAASGEPSVEIPDAAAPTTLVVQPLIVGDGPVVKAGQTVTVHYRGVLWRDGKTFDSSWKRGKTIDFAIGVGQVISGWDTGIVGQTVGSQVLLVIPPDQGYGAAGAPGAGITGTDTLVFVVDILAAS